MKNGFGGFGNGPLVDVAAFVSLTPGNILPIMRVMPNAYNCQHRTVYPYIFPLQLLSWECLRHTRLIDKKINQLDLMAFISEAGNYMTVCGQYWDS